MEMSIVMITYNRKDELKKCLGSLSNQIKKPDEVIVVDNNSTDGTVEMLKKKFPQVKIIILPENKGLCFAANVGFKNSHGKYVGIIESDMTLTSNWVEEVIKEFERNPKAGIVCPYFLHWSKYGWVDCEFETEDDYIFMTNGSFAIRKDIFDKTGQNLYDSEYFLYAQEEELSARVFNLGYKIKRIRTAKSFHKPSVSHARIRFKMWQFYNLRNNFWNLWIFHSLGNIIFFTPIYFLKFFWDTKDPIHFSNIIIHSMMGIPHCLRKRQVVNMERYKNFIINLKYIRTVQKTHHYFNWETGEIDPRYMDKIVK
jgi:GT2 family glycosyltransferase